MTRKTTVLLAILVLLGLGTWWLTRRSAHAGSTLDTEATAFAVADTASIDKIFVASKSGQQHTLRRVARNYWRLDERYDVRPDMIKMLLETLKRVRVKSPVPRTARNTVIRSLAAGGLKVEIYQHGELANTFYVGRPTEDMEGTYMIRHGAEQPFITHIPGFVGFLTSRFYLTPRAWRSVVVFNTPLRQLESVEVQAAGQPDQTFTVRREGSSFVLDGLPAGQADTTKIRLYAALYGRVSGQNYLDSTQVMMADSLLHTPPHYVITVRARGAAKPDRVRLWRPKGDVNNLAAVTDRDPKEVMSVQNFVFQNLLLKRADFLKKQQ